jgi:hypothetical protein
VTPEQVQGTALLSVVRDAVRRSTAGENMTSDEVNELALFVASHVEACGLLKELS